jgi:thiamine-monophosphate kinase
MKESDLLAHIARRSADLAARFGQVVVGPGDDCAVVRTPSGDELLLTVDHLVEGRHFEPGTPIDLIARKAVARSVSDIAAMGGTPSWGLATGCLPRGYQHGDALFEAMHKWACHWGCPLVGGDIAASEGPMVLTVTVGGVMGTRWVEEWIDAPLEAKDLTRVETKPVLRSGARPGDTVFERCARGARRTR